MQRSTKNNNTPSTHWPHLLCQVVRALVYCLFEQFSCWGLSIAENSVGMKCFNRLHYTLTLLLKIEPNIH